MKLFSLLVAALTLLSGAIAADVQKSVLVTYPPETPDSIVDQAKKAVIDAGGMITHEYTLIKYVSASFTNATWHADQSRGFAAKVGEKILDTVSAMGQQYHVLIEEDQEVHVAGGEAGL